MPPGTAVDEISSIPPLNLAANDAATTYVKWSNLYLLELTYGGMGAC